MGGWKYRWALGVITLALLGSCSTPRPYTGGDAGQSPPGSGGGRGGNPSGPSTGGVGGVVVTGTGGMVSTGGLTGAGGGFVATGSGGMVSTGGLNGAGGSGDCNGMSTQECTCSNGATRDCGHAAIGSCKMGKSTCQNGAWSACVGNIDPAPRDCTSANDNDCDGKPDNTVDAVCKCASGASPQICDQHLGKDGNGPCKAGSQSCVVSADKTNSDWGACSGSVGPGAADTCDAGNDNNCNGIVNEGCPCVNGATQSCGHAAVGICKQGKSTCQNNAWGSCVGNVDPGPRDCTSSSDNDCDGKPDSTLDGVCKCTAGGSQSCGAHPGNDGNGPCKAGTQACVVAANKSTSDWGACTGSVGPMSKDTCDPNNDNNCNGTANDGCSCVNGQPVTCACGPATTCTNGVKGTCSGTKVTMYVDGDGDGYGQGSPSQQCPGTSGYSTNADDCDDANSAFKPGVSICSTVTQKRTCPATGGISTATPCDQGCLNGACRTDGTIGLPGYVSCTNSSHCLAGDGCMMDDPSGGCGTSGSGSNVLIHCDGPNDCPGQICLFLTNRTANESSCYASQPADGGGSEYQQVCDPLASSCQSPLTCLKAGRYPLYLCQ